MRKLKSLVLVSAGLFAVPLFISSATSLLASSAVGAAARKLMVVGNWKANDLLDETALDHYSQSGISHQNSPVDLLCAPPHVQLRLVSERTQLTVVAQEISAHPPGAFTGEVTAEAARRAGARFALIGHSERRKLCGETNSVIERKLRRALSSNLGVILCVGDQSRDDDLPSVLQTQLEPLLAAISDQQFPSLDFSTVVIAYEPVWAIGTGRAPAPAEVAQVLSFLRQHLEQKLGRQTSEQIRLLYGGSVTEQNASSFVAAAPQLDGLLVGAASLDPPRFLAIVRQVASIASTRLAV